MESFVQSVPCACKRRNADQFNPPVQGIEGERRQRIGGGVGDNGTQPKAPCEHDSSWSSDDKQSDVGPKLGVKSRPWHSLQHCNRRFREDSITVLLWAFISNDIGLLLARQRFFVWPLLHFPRVRVRRCGGQTATSQTVTVGLQQINVKHCVVSSIKSLVLVRCTLQPFLHLLSPTTFSSCFLHHSLLFFKRLLTNLSLK